MENQKFFQDLRLEQMLVERAEIAQPGEILCVSGLREETEE
jgi:hypothetical protein